MLNMLCYMHLKNLRKEKKKRRKNGGEGDRCLLHLAIPETDLPLHLDSFPTVFFYS